MSKSVVGGLVVAGALMFVGVLAAQATDGFGDTLADLCAMPDAHEYCAQGDCVLLNTENREVVRQMIRDAYERGLQEGAAGKK